MYVVQTTAGNRRQLKAILTLTEKTGPGYELSATRTIGREPCIPRAKTMLYARQYTIEYTLHASCIYDILSVHTHTHTVYMCEYARAGFACTHLVSKMSITTWSLMYTNTLRGQIYALKKKKKNDLILAILLRYRCLILHIITHSRIRYRYSCLTTTLRFWILLIPVIFTFSVLNKCYENVRLYNCLITQSYKTFF